MELPSLFRSCGCAADSMEPEQTLNVSGNQPFNFSKYNIAFLDLDSRDWHHALLEAREHIPVVAFSVPDIMKAVEAMKLGAVDFYGKPLTRSVLSGMIMNLDRKRRTNNDGIEELIGISRPMQEVFGLIRKAAVSDSNVLITGESGTGKEPAARAIHRLSPRKDKSFMTINCSAIPDTLLESELFGFEKGAFTGANYTKKGILELADGGTVLLDEIGDVSHLFQTKVLRVLQEGEIMRIGGTRQISVDVRVIAATNRDLRMACRQGTFREDLYYRLNVINIHLPTLRERPEDIPALTEHFIKKYAAMRKDLLISGITDDAMDVLSTYSYRGNVRELENIIERAISFANYPEILPADLPSSLSHPRKRARSTKMKDAVTTFERELIWSALQESRGNISKAATSLGIHRQQLQRKLRSLKIAT